MLKASREGRPRRQRPEGGALEQEPGLWTWEAREWGWGCRDLVTPLLLQAYTGCQHVCGEQKRGTA